MSVIVVFGRASENYFVRERKPSTLLDSSAVLTDAPSTASAADLAEIPWAHVTPRYRALGHDFAIRTTDVALGRYLEYIFGGMAAGGKPQTMYSFVTTAATPWPYVLYQDTRRLTLSGHGSYVLSFLMWHLNRAVVEATPGLILLHAAGVERDGVGMLLPAAMEAGKTTLTAALLCNGFRYLSDETVGIDPRTGLAHPYPKPLSIDQGSWQVLDHLRPQLDDHLDPYLGQQWQVPPSACGAEALKEPVPLGLVVAPQYRARARTTLEPLSRAEALHHLISQTFSFSTASRRKFTDLAAVLRSVECHRLTVGDLDEACALLSSLVAGSLNKERERRR